MEQETNKQDFEKLQKNIIKRSLKDLKKGKIQEF